METTTQMTNSKKFRYGAYDVMRKNNRMSALESFGIEKDNLTKIDTEMKSACGAAGKKWSIYGCFDEVEDKE